MLIQWLFAESYVTELRNHKCTRQQTSPHFHHPLQALPEVCHHPRGVKAERSSLTDAATPLPLVSHPSLLTAHPVDGSTALAVINHVFCEAEAFSEACSMICDPTRADGTAGASPLTRGRHWELPSSFQWARISMGQCVFSAERDLTIETTHVEWNKAGRN